MFDTKHFVVPCIALMTGCDLRNTKPSTRATLPTISSFGIKIRFWMYRREIKLAYFSSLLRAYVVAIETLSECKMGRRLSVKLDVWRVSSSIFSSALSNVPPSRRRR